MAIALKSKDSPADPETKTPVIPPPTDNLKSLTATVKAMKEIIEVREGQRGNSLDQNVTVRDLHDAGMVQLNLGGNYYPPGDGTGSFNPASPPPNLAIPPQPEGFVVTGGFSNIFLSWTPATEFYSNHAFAEVWRNTVDNLGTAALVGETAASFFADPVGNNTQFYYWIRFVSTANIDGPYNATAGTAGKTSLDPVYAMDTLKSKVAADLASGFRVLRIGRQSATDTQFEKVIIDCTRFAIVDTSAGETNTKIPFIVDTGVVYIDVAMIKDASITSAKIGSLVADKITAGTISVAVTLNAATINGGSLNINNRFKVFSDGTTELYTDHFYILDPTSGNAYAPFFVETGVVYIDTARIKNLNASKIVSGNTNGNPTFGTYIDRVKLQGGSQGSFSFQTANLYMNGAQVASVANIGFVVWTFFLNSNHTLTDTGLGAAYRIGVGTYVFNTYLNSTAKADMASFLNGLGANQWVVMIATSGYAETDANLLAAMKTCGATGAADMSSTNVPASGFYYYAPYALIGVSGRGEGTGAEARTLSGVQAEVSAIWVDSDINGSGYGLTGLTVIEGGKIRTGTIQATSIVANSITASQIAAGTITADRMNVTNLSAIAATLGNVTAGKLNASYIETGCMAVDPNLGGSMTSFPMGTTGASSWSMGATTGSLGTAVTTSTNLRMYGPSATGSTYWQRVKSGAFGSAPSANVLIQFTGIVDDYLSLWYRINGGAWNFLQTIREPQTGYGVVGLHSIQAISLAGPSDFIDFGFSCTASDGTTNSGNTEIRYGYASMIIFNL